MAFDIEGAINAGYSPDEIAQHLAGQKNFDYAGAMKAGYSADEIIQHLNQPDEEPGFMQQHQNIIGPIEAGVSMVSAMPAQMAGGLTFLGALGTGQGVDAARAQYEDVTKKGQEWTQYQPRTETGKLGVEALAHYMEELNKYGGKSFGGAARDLGAGPQAADLAETTGKVLTEFAQNLVPLYPALPKGVKGAKPRPSAEGRIDPNAALEAAKAERAKDTPPAAPETAPVDPLKARHQQELGLEPPGAVDTSGAVNPYDGGGYVSDAAAGMDTTLPGQGMVVGDYMDPDGTRRQSVIDGITGDLFAQGLSEKTKSQPEIVQAMDAFRDEQADLSGRINLAIHILDSKSSFPRAFVKEVKEMFPELMTRLQASDRQYAEGMDLLSQEKPRDAEGKPIYNQPEPLVQPAGPEGDLRPNKPIDVKTKADANATAIPPKEPKAPKGAKPLPAKFGKQGGFIHPDLLGLGKAVKMLKRLGDVDFLKLFEGTFGGRALARAAMASADQGTNEQLVFMSPREFLRLASERSDPISPESNAKRARIREGLNTETGLADIPYLMIEPRHEGSFEVYGHEGRHRADVLHDMGVDLIPVKLRVDDWNKADGPLPFEPKDLEGQRTFGRAGSRSKEGWVSIEDLDGSLKKYGDTYFDHPPVPPEPDITPYLEKYSDPGTADQLTPSQEAVLAKAKQEVYANNMAERLVASLKKQRGGAKGTWNPHEVKQKLLESGRELVDMLKQDPNIKIIPEVERGAQLLTDDTKVRDDVLRGIIGGKLDLIGKTVPVETALEQAKQHPDIFGGRAFSAGANAKAEASGNPAMKAFYRAWDNAHKRGEQWDRDYVRPVAAALKPLFASPNKLQTLFKLMRDEQEAKQAFTPEQLRRAGIPSDIIQAHQMLRGTYEKVLELVNQVRRSKGLKEVKAEMAYLSHRFQGPWRATIVETLIAEDGKPYDKVVWRVAEQSRGDAADAIKYILDKHPNLKAGKVEYQARHARSDVSAFQQTLSDMVELLGDDDPVVQKISDTMKTFAESQTSNVFGQERHFKKKTGVQGYVGSRFWDKSDYKKFFEQQLQYMKNGFEWAETQAAVEWSNKFTADPFIVANRENLKNFMTEYSKHQQGVGTATGFKWAEDRVAELFGITPAKIDEYIGVPKSAFYITKLGLLNLPFTASQLIQPIFTAPYHVHLTNEGYNHTVGNTVLDATLRGGQFVTMNWAWKLGRTKMAEAVFKQLDPFWRETFLYAMQNGVVDINPLSDIRDMQKNKYVKGAEDIAGANIQVSEHVARGQAFMGFVSHLKQSGKYPDTPEGRLELFRRAEDATKYTMVDYRPSERAMFFQRLGTTGKALSSLQSFKINTVNQHVKYLTDAVEGVKKGNVNAITPWLTYMGLYFAFGGLAGTVGLDELDTLWRMTTSWIPDKMWAKLPEKFREFSPKKSVMELPEMVSVGPVSALTGVNLYSRFGQNNLTPFDPNGMSETLGQAFPFISDMWAQGIGAKDFFMSSDPYKSLAGGYAATPSSAKGIYEEMMPGFLGDDGEGNAIVPSPLTPEKGQYTRSPGERNLRLTGFKSAKEARERELNYRTQQMEKGNDDRLDSLSKAIKNTIVAGGSTTDLDHAIGAYERLGGDPDTVFEGIDKAIFIKNSNRLDQMINNAQSGNYRNVMKLLRYMESIGVR